MISFFANIFGYLLNFLYNIVNNYGIAIILFSIIIKIIMIPLSIKQQKTMKKSAKMQEEMKQIQFKYKNDPEKMNQETMELYKRENMSPFSGCLSAIVQIILLFSVFYLVRQPLTYMKKIDSNVISNYTAELKEEGKTSNNAYPEIDIIREKGNQDESVKINMEFFGLDLSKIPTSDAKDYKVWIIPVLYVLSSIVSMKITNKIQENSSKNINGDNTEKEENPMEQANKSMSLMMPIMAVSIAIVAPLGMALYWLLNNILMILERLLLNKVIKDEEETKNA